MSIDVIEILEARIAALWEVTPPSGKGG